MVNDKSNKVFFFVVLLVVLFGRKGLTPVLPDGVPRDT